jgi:hypothetical protein
MKPKNFPGRKHQRQVEALERLKLTLKSYPPTVLPEKKKLTEKQIKHLEVIIAKPFQTHTKKSRVGTGNLIRI